MKYQGVSISDGLAKAKLYMYSPQLPEIKHGETLDTGFQVQLATDTFKQARQELQILYNETKENIGSKEAEIFDAHLTILKDEYSVCEPIIQRIYNNSESAAEAIDNHLREIADIFGSLNDELMCQRVSDAEDIRKMLLRICLGCGRQDLSHLPEDVIILTEELTPSDTARMDAKHVKGIITRLGGATAHSAIIARTLGIPAIAGIDGWQNKKIDGHMAILNGEKGTVIIDPDNEQLESFDVLMQEYNLRQKRLEEFKFTSSKTKDGHSFEVCGNIGNPQEAFQALSFGADGIGLFRSEFLFMNRDSLPTEDEQFEAYRRVLATMENKPVIIRTLDIGGDKKIPSLDLPNEENPFLGFRAIRMTLKRQDVFKPQLRAMLRAAAYGRLKIMFPMINSLDELRAAKTLLNQQAEALRSEGIKTGPVEIGIMIEIPAAALLAEEFAKEVDFFSIGTNDLIQYTLAVERGNAYVAELYRPQHLAVIRLIAMTGRAAKAHHIPCGMCGEAAGDERLAPAFLGMGINELSMNPRRIPYIRKLLSELTIGECRQASEALLQIHKN